MPYQIAFAAISYSGVVALLQHSKSLVDAGLCVLTSETQGERRAHLRELTGEFDARTYTLIARRNQRCRYVLFTPVEVTGRIRQA